MIGAFARLLGNRERVLVCEQTGEHAYSVKSRSDEGDKAAETSDGPPDRFVEKFQYDGGDVFFAPVLETLRAVLRGRPRVQETVPHSPQKDQPDEN